MKMKLHVTPRLEEAEANKRIWDKNCSRIKFKPDDFGKEFTIRGKTYTICGYSAGAKKFPILMQDKTGKRWKFSPDQLRKREREGTASPERNKKCKDVHFTRMEWCRFLPYFSGPLQGRGRSTHRRADRKAMHAKQRRRG
jgi:hypothetical protein